MGYTWCFGLKLILNIARSPELLRVAPQYDRDSRQSNRLADVLLGETPLCHCADTFLSDMFCSCFAQWQRVCPASNNLVRGSSQSNKVNLNVFLGAYTQTSISMIPMGCDRLFGYRKSKQVALGSRHLKKTVWLWPMTMIGSI